MPNFGSSKIETVAQSLPKNLRNEEEKGRKEEKRQPILGLGRVKKKEKKKKQELKKHGKRAEPLALFSYVFYACLKVADFFPFTPKTSVRCALPGNADYCPMPN